MDSRVSATGLKSVELDELTTNQIIINNEGLQYFHKYNIFLPTVTEGYYNLQEELDNIMISNTTQDLELIQLETRMGAAEGSITTLGAGLLLTSGGTLLALDLVNQKSWILFFQKPLRSDISSNVYLDFDTNYFKVDTSNNLTLNDFWKKDISNNLYFTSGKIGIGITNPGTNYDLDVLTNINCAEIYRNGTPISSTLSLFLPLTGGTLTGVLSGTTISATNMTAATFSGSGASLNSLNASNVSSGTLSISRGGIGTTTLTANQILIGNTTTSILQSPNLTWDNTTNTLSSSNFVGNGSQLTSLNASNVSLGTLAITRGGIGTTTLTANQILIGNTTTSILQSPNLTWNNTTNTLSSSNFVGNGSGLTSLNASSIISGTLSVNGSGLNSLNASNVTLGTLSVSRGGIGTTSLINNQVLLGSGTNPINQSSNLLFDTSNNRLGICKASPNYTLDVSGNINGNNLFLQNLSNANNTLINILSETNDYNSKLIVGSGYLGSNRALSTFVDVSTCQIITKTNNLYIDSALNKSININSEGQGNINSYGPWTHNSDLSANNIKATSFIENNVSLINKYVKKHGFSFVTATPIAIVSTPYFKYDINLNNYTTTINFDGLVPTRKFRIMTWLKSGYHEVSPTSNLDYEIIMSNPASAGAGGLGSAGLNIQAYSLSDAKNYKLDKTSSTGQFILRNSFNYLSYVSTVQNTNIACLIIDYF